MAEVARPMAPIAKNKRKQPEGDSDVSMNGPEKKARTAEATAEEEKKMQKVKSDVEALMSSFKAQAHVIVEQTLPKKILRLTELHAQLIKGVNSELIISDKSCPCNQGIVSLLDPLKVEVGQLVEHCSTLEMWIQLNIPRIQDQKGIGVSVKEEIADMLHSGKQAGLQVLESITKYFITRAKLLTKALKWPQAEDYRKAVQDLDEKTFNSLCSMCLDLRNNYLIMYDAVVKNMDRITKASAEASALFY